MNDKLPTIYSLKNPAIIALMDLKKEEAIPTIPEPVVTPDAIYFDTNLLHAARWPKGTAQLLQIVQNAERLGIKLFLPEVVCQELEGLWLRSVASQWKSANSQVAALSGMLKPLKHFDKLPELPSNEELLEKFHLDSHGLIEKFVIVGTTARPVSDFVNMAIFREGTFDDSGDGFRDCVILCSVLEHTIVADIKHGIFVSNDKDFQRPGVAPLISKFKVNLKILRSLDEVDELLKQTKNAAVREYFEQERRELVEALNARIKDLEEYLVNNLAVAPSQLTVWGNIKKIESLEVLQIENVYTTFGIETGADDEKVKVSADIQIRLILDIERYLPLQPEKMLRVGGEVAPSDNPSEIANSVTSEYLGNLAKLYDGIAVVEADAVKTDDGYSDIHFKNAYLKQSNPGFGALGIAMNYLK